MQSINKLVLEDRNCVTGECAVLSSVDASMLVNDVNEKSRVQIEEDLEEERGGTLFFLVLFLVPLCSNNVAKFVIFRRCTPIQIF